MAVHLHGIRHHGPGSARSLLQAFASLQPDIVLIEGPPEADALVPLLAHEDMKPPVAVLVYASEDPKQAVFYPFAVFSPEWQALRYAAEKKVPVRFMDLSQSFQFSLKKKDSKVETAPEVLPDEEIAAGSDLSADDPPDANEPPSPERIHRDPLNWLAEAAGFSDGESWWEHMVEHRRDGDDIFAAITEAMTALRQELPPIHDEGEQVRERAREAQMRQCIRKAEKDGFQRIAVVCGAWHVPALATMPAAKEDAALLKSMESVKVQATCVPWTHGRLSMYRGYAAGVQSPGWYHHLFTAKDEPVIRWMTRVARLLREQDLDASSAHVIEAVRLSEALAALRERPLPGLAELNEAVLSVLCQGNDMPMQLIGKKLIVGELMGEVPDAVPRAPLQEDVLREQKRLRLKADGEQRELDLDLRNSNELDRSLLLHRLRLIGVPWGERRGSSRKTSTFHEVWAICWNPEFEIRLIEMGAWGNALPQAAAGYVRHLAEQASDLATITGLISDVLLCDLPEATEHVARKLQSEAAVATDVLQLMAALPPLLEVGRYGNVRQTDLGLVKVIVHELAPRICVGLPVACASLSDEAAAQLDGSLATVDEALKRAEEQQLRTEWLDALQRLATQSGVHGLIAGHCCRLLLDAQAISVEEAARRLNFALSANNDLVYAGSWCEGFLKGSGLLLIHDETVWNIVDAWVADLTPDHFTQLLPILRRAFSAFQTPERRQLGERVVARRVAVQSASTDAEFNEERANKILPVLAQILGLKYPTR